MRPHPDPPPVAEATCSVLGSSPKLACRSTVWPLRHTFILALVSGAVAATMRGRSRSWLTSSAVERQDHVALLQAGLRARAVRRDDGDQRAVLALQAEAGGDGRRHLLDLHAEPAAADLAVLFELRDDGLGDIRRHRETDPDAAAVGRIDRGVDADHLAVEVEGRPAGIAAVDRRVDLQEIVELAGVDVAAARRNDAGRDACRRARTGCRPR